MCLPLLIFPFTVKSRSSLLAPALPGGPGKRAIKWLWWQWLLILCSLAFTSNIDSRQVCMKNMTEVVIVVGYVKIDLNLQGIFNHCIKTASTESLLL